MDLVLLIAISVFSIPLICVLDSVLFSKYLVCDKCGDKPTAKMFLVPTVIEIGCFLVGVLVGVSYFIN